MKSNDSNCRKMVDISTNVCRSMISSVGLANFLVGLHNSFTHGKILNENNYLFDDADLGELFDGLEKLNSVARKIEAN